MCEFTFDHNKDPNLIYDKAQSAIVANGGVITGDEKAGSFTIEKFGMAVKGRYEIGSNKVKLFVDEKPFFVSCNQIEVMIGTQFS